MASTDPLVSVIVTNYNYGRFLKDCIDSVLAQNYPRIELVVVDDGSTDNSRVVLEQYGSRIKTVWQANQGQAAALSAGFLHCAGDIICVLDADDGFYPNKARVLVDTFAAHPEVQWIRHKLELVDEELRPFPHTSPPFTGSAVVWPDPMLLIERIVAAGTALAMRRALAERVFPLDLEPELMIDADDTMLLARIFEARATGYSVDEVLGYYRRHSSHRWGVHELSRLLEHEAAVTTALARIFAMPLIPVSAHKHRAIVAAIDGAPWWDRKRLGNYARGLRSAIALWKRPTLCARQVAGLTFAFVAPETWVERLKRSQSFYEPPPATAGVVNAEAAV